MKGWHTQVKIIQDGVSIGNAYKCGTMKAGYRKTRMDSAVHQRAKRRKDCWNQKVKVKLKGCLKMSSGL